MSCMCPILDPSFGPIKLFSVVNHSWADFPFRVETNSFVQVQGARSLKFVLVWIMGNSTFVEGLLKAGFGV